MKCHKCGYTMEKDYDTRTATCPMCGRKIYYKTKADKKRGYRYYPDSDGSYSGCGTFVVTVLGIMVVAAAIGVLALFGVFKNGIWAGIGDILMFFLNLIWKIISGVATFIWNIIVWLFHLVFG